MAISNVSENAASNAVAASNQKTSSKSQNLGVEDFFTLLAAQLQNQSMFNPVEDTEFMSQMAQFSSLQQMQELTKSFDKMMSVSLVGKNISAQVTDATNASMVVSGKVEGVQISNGKSYLCIGQYRVDPSNVLAVTQD